MVRVVKGSASGVLLGGRTSADVIGSVVFTVVVNGVCIQGVAFTASHAAIGRRRRWVPGYAQTAHLAMRVILLGENLLPGLLQKPVCSLVVGKT